MKYNICFWKDGQLKNNGPIINALLENGILVNAYLNIQTLTDKNKGKIINISSIYGVVGPDQNLYFDNRKKYTGRKPIEYSVAKSGIIGFTKALASFYQNTGIDIICLIFGGVDENQEKKFVKKYSNKTIIGRMIKKGEYNKIIDFIISNETKYLSGSCIDLSGGCLSML